MQKMAAKIAELEQVDTPRLASFTILSLSFRLSYLMFPSEL
jgi:hypothetical protein